MAKQYLMAVDAGTGSVRAVLFDTKGSQLAVSYTHLDVYKRQVVILRNFQAFFISHWSKILLV